LRAIPRPHDQFSDGKTREKLVYGVLLEYYFRDLFEFIT
jgi:hypothetical protein